MNFIYLSLHYWGIRSTSDHDLISFDEVICNDYVIISILRKENTANDIESEGKFELDSARFPLDFARNLFLLTFPKSLTTIETVSPFTIYITCSPSNGNPFIRFLMKTYPLMLKKCQKNKIFPTPCLPNRI
jgi:hypothetical protein